MKVTLKDLKAAIGYIKGVEPLFNQATELKRLELAISTNMINDEVKTQRPRRRSIRSACSGRSSRWSVAFELTSKPTVAQVFTSAFLPPAAERQLS